MSTTDIMAQPESFPMNGGNGKNSYSKNSTVQREGSMIVKAMIDEAIAENLDIENIPFTYTNTFRIADLGCSVGPNTFICMQNILEAVQKKYQSKGEKSQKLPKFQVLFSDHSNNDFNTLFASLPQKKNYLAAGVPCSFYDRLFPENSLHIVHSSFALHWLSEVPQEVLDKDSPAWNKGEIFYTSSSDEVANAYAAQFAKDIRNFLNLRAKEIVKGGMMILIMPAKRHEIHRSQMPGGWFYDSLGSCLMDMADEGLISKDQVDAINLPMYRTSDKEMEDMIEENGCFSIEKMELTNPLMRIDEPLDMQRCTVHIRATVEGIFTKHFGSNEIMDEIFERFDKNAAPYSNMAPEDKKGVVLFAALKRK